MKPPRIIAAAVKRDQAVAPDRIGDHPFSAGAAAIQPRAIGISNLHYARRCGRTRNIN
jgi:hypothetical protein